MLHTVIAPSSKPTSPKSSPKFLAQTAASLPSVPAQAVLAPVHDETGFRVKGYTPSTSERDFFLGTPDSYKGALRVPLMEPLRLAQ